jgi:hypothetical protein
VSCVIFAGALIVKPVGWPISSTADEALEAWLAKAREALVMG